MRVRSKSVEGGVSLMGLILVLLVLGVMATFGMKLFPTVTEYMAAKRAIVYAKAAGSSATEIRASFDKQAEINDIKAVSGKDLAIAREADGVEVSFAYQKKIPLAGPASLLIDYQGSTAPQVSGGKNQ